MATASATLTTEPLDTTVRLVTPERITFQYPLAGPFRRAWAYLIDLLMRIVLFTGALIIAQLLAFGSFSGVGLALVVLFFMEWGYPGFCEAVFNGQTPGKRAVHIRVVSAQGVPITGAQAVIRNLLRAVDGLPFAYVPGLLSVCLTHKFQRLGDLAAGTMVIVESAPRRRGVVRVDEPAVAALLPALPVRIAAGPELARALSDYVVHRGRLGRGRREEMAAPLAQVLRRRYDLPLDATNDAILCAVYHRVFLGD
jgi:uncharacterized RDD family membrane protein YckC